MALPPVDVKWPWFGQAYTQLASGNFGPAFSAAILKYIELEECTNFGVGVVRSGFKKTEVKGFLNVTHHGHLHGEDGWACLHRHGQNGWYTILATVVWWATMLRENGSSHARWLAAVEDVNWVLPQVVGSSDSSLLRYVLLVSTLTVFDTALVLFLKSPPICLQSSSKKHKV